MKQTRKTLKRKKTRAAQVKGTDIIKLSKAENVCMYSDAHTHIFMHTGFLTDAVLAEVPVFSIIYGSQSFLFRNVYCSMLQFESTLH